MLRAEEAEKGAYYLLSLAGDEGGEESVRIRALFALLAFLSPAQLRKLASTTLQDIQSLTRPFS